MRFKPKRAIWMIVLAAALLVRVSSTPARAQRDAWDLLWKGLEPLAAMLAEDGGEKRAMLEARFECAEAPGFPQGFPGATVSLVLRPPDGLRLEVDPGPAPVTGTPADAFRAWWERGAKVGRDGQTMWACPGSLAETWLRTMAPLPKPERRYHIEDFRLPFPKKQLVFLPGLFAMEDLGATETGRRLRLRFIPELARSIGTGEGSAEIDLAPDGTPRRIAVEDGDFRVAVKVLAWTYRPADAAPTAFAPPPGEKDILRINGTQLWQIVTALKQR